MMPGTKFFSALLLTFIIIGTATAQTTGAKTTTNKYKGLQISLSDLTASISTIDSLLHFKAIPNNTKGLPKVTAKGSYGARIEITGTEDNVTKAQWTVGQPATGTLSKLAFTRMAFFVNMLAKQEGAAWFFEQMNNYNKAPTLPLNNIFLINGAKLMFDYAPDKKVFTITVSSE